MVSIFGKPWDVPFCADADQAPTPVGEECVHCDEVIESGDRGIIVPTLSTLRMIPGPELGASATLRWLPAHMECNFRGVVGSLAHLLGQCACAGIEERTPTHAVDDEEIYACICTRVLPCPLDGEPLSEHDEARAVVRWVERVGRGGEPF